MEKQPTNEQNCCPNCGHDLPVREQTINDLGSLAVNRNNKDGASLRMDGVGPRVYNPVYPEMIMFKVSTTGIGEDAILQALEEKYPPKKL